jgi:hypothetical protein
MLTETTAPSLLFITSLVSLVLIGFQVSFLHKSRWDIHNAQSIRRLLALCVTIFIVFLSALSGILGLVAFHAGRTGDSSLAARAGVGGKIIVVILQSGRKSLHMSSSKTQIQCKSVLVSVYMMFLLNLKALVEPIPSTYIGILTFGKVRTLTAVMYSPLVASKWSPSLSVLFMYLIRDAPDTTLSIVFAALQEDYPAARFPALCWLLFFIPLFCVSILLYLSIRRAEEYSIIARLWLVLAVGHACGVLSATCALVGKGDFQAPTSLFDAFWITCVTFALHSALFRPPGLHFTSLTTEA